MGTENQSLLRLEQVSARIQLGRSWIWGAVKRGEFPAPKKLSARCTRWDSTLVDKWITNALEKNKTPSLNSNLKIKNWAAKQELLLVNKTITDDFGNLVEVSA